MLCMSIIPSNFVRHIKYLSPWIKAGSSLVSDIIPAGSMYSVPSLQLLTLRRLCSNVVVCYHLGLVVDLMGGTA